MDLSADCCRQPVNRINPTSGGFQQVLILKCGCIFLMRTHGRKCDSTHYQPSYLRIYNNSRSRFWGGQFNPSASLQRNLKFSKSPKSQNWTLLEVPLWNHPTWSVHVSPTSAAEIMRSTPLHWSTSPGGPVALCGPSEPFGGA